MKIVSCVVSFLLIFTLTFTVSASTIKDLQKKQEGLDKEIKDAQQKFDSLNSQKNEVELEMDKIDKEVGVVEEELDVINVHLEKTTILYNMTEKELAQAQEDREIQWSIFKKRARYMYMHGKTGYLDILLKSRSFSDLLNKIEYTNRIVKYDQGIAKRLKASEDLVNKKLEETNKQKKEILVLKGHQETKLAALEEKLSVKEAFIDNLDADSAKYAQIIKVLDASDKEIENLIAQKQRESVKYGGTSASVAPPYKGGRLSWPVPASGRISSPFGSRTNPINKGGEFHSGIDIPAPTGANIVSSADGVVVSARWINGYGVSVLVDHGSGIYTFYAHCSKFLVSPGQKVSNGEPIAKVGSTGYSTGPHLHYEVRVNGKPQNPLNYLNK